MAKANITKRAVDAAIPGTKSYFLWDEKIAGFGLKVTPAGGKTYVFQFRLAAPGKADATAPARYTIGKHGKLGADAVVKANYGDPKITAFSWGSVKATGVAIKFKKAEPVSTPTQSPN